MDFRCRVNVKHLSAGNNADKEREQSTQPSVQLVSVRTVDVSFSDHVDPATFRSEKVDFSWRRENHRIEEFLQNFFEKF